MSGLPSGTVTFLLTDIEGSTRMWDRFPDAMSAALARHDHIIESAVAANAGTLVKTKGEGDATFSVFAGATDAARAALAAQAELATEPWSDGTALRVRMALHTGEAIERGGDYFGTTVNRAARLRALASGAQVFVSQPTADAIRAGGAPDLELVPLGQHALKDLAEPEDVFALLGPGIEPMPREVRTDLPTALALDANTPFVGRESELARLETAAEEARRGSTTAVFVGGEPGVGKTTLVSALAERVSGDALVLFGHCDEHLGVPYQPFAEALETYVRACPPALLRRQAGSGARELVRLVPHIADVLPDLAPPSAADAETERFRLFSAVADLVGAIGQSQPVVLVLDDLHWATQPTLLLMRHVLKHTDTSLLVLATYRDTELDRTHPLAAALADFRAEANVERLSVRGLSTDGVYAYLEAAAGGATLDPRAHELAYALWSETQGNPFFVQEVLAHLVETGAVFEQAGVWTAGGGVGVEQLGLPEGVREVITRRLSRLSPDTNKVLAVASVAGTSFSTRLLEQVSGLEEDPLLDALDEARAAGLLREESSQYFFAHALIRHTLYGELSAARRTRLHRRIGEALERIGAEGDEDRYLRALAHHFAEAALDGAMQQALDYALAAGRRAMDRGALEEAVLLLERGVDLACLGDDVDLTKRCELNLALTAIHHRRGFGEDVTRTGEAAVADARALGDRTLFARAAGERFFAEVGVPCDGPLGLAREAIAMLGETEPALRVWLMSQCAVALAGSYGDRDGADAIARQAMEVAEHVEDPLAMWRALEAQSFLLLATPDLAQRWRVIEQQDALLTRIGDPSLQALVWDQRSQLALARGEMDEYEVAIAREAPFIVIDWDPIMRSLLSGDFAAAKAQLGAPIGEGANFFNAYAAQLYQLHRDQGAFTELIPLLQFAIAETPLIAAFRAGLALALAEDGQFSEAEGELNELMKQDLAGVPRDQQWPTFLVLACETAALLGNHEHATTLYEIFSPWAGQAIVVFVSVVVLGPADRVLGMLAAALGRDDDAEAHFTEAARVAKSLKSPPWVARTHLAHAAFLASRGHYARARGLAAEACELAGSLGMVKVAARASALLDQLAE